MAFSNFGQGSNTANTMANAATSQGPDLEVIQTERLGFLALAGEARLALLPKKWSPPPAPHASLITIAPRQGLVAAAGPDVLVLATTDSVRNGFSVPKSGDDETRSFQPQRTVPLPTRVSQLTFTADETFLIMSAEQGGGLAVYETQSLLQGNTDPSFQVPTNGEALRYLVPNPTREKSELCAVVTEKGNLLVANMKEKNFVSGSNGQIFKAQVSCAVWSTRGKQIIAGMGDGTMIQITPDGVVKAEIPRPTELDDSFYVAFVMWLENDLFLTFHVSTQSMSRSAPISKCHLITRDKQTFVFQKLEDPVNPFGSDSVPYHTAARLKDFPPDLQDLLIFSSTATPDIGMLTRSKAPLTSSEPADKITNVFTVTEMADDSKRAIMPMGADYTNPPPIGTSLDLTSQDVVQKPIPTDEMDQSPGPVPGYWVLNADGVLSAWWVIYTPSIRNGTTYPGLAAAVEGSAQASMPSTTPVKSGAFGAASPSPLGAPNNSTTSPFGAPAAAPSATAPPSSPPKLSAAWASGPSTSSNSGGGNMSFGSSSFGKTPAATAPKMGNASWGCSNTFGSGSATSAFGAAPAASSPFSAVDSGGSAFGQAFGQANKTTASPFGRASSSTASPFGQPAAAQPSPFGQATETPKNIFGSGTSTASGGGFASYASKDTGGLTGFAALGANKPSDGGSIFAQKTEGSNSFASAPLASSKPAESVFGSKPFQLVSSFKRDPNAKDEDNAPAENTKNPFSNFGSALGDLTKSPGAGAPAAQSTTPTATPAATKFANPGSSSPAPSMFGDRSKVTSSPFGGLLGQRPLSSGADIKQNATSAPLPPDSTSKMSFSLGDSPLSSVTSADSPRRIDALDAPLPPDPLTFKPKPKPEPDQSPVAAAADNDAPLPPDPTRNKAMYNINHSDLPGAGTRPAQLTSTPPTKKEPAPGSGPAAESPLPPDSVKSNKFSNVESQTPPTVKPSSKTASVFDSVPRAAPGFKFPTTVPPVSDSSDDGVDEEDDDDELAGSEIGTEGSGVDVAKELSPQSDKAKTPGYTPQSSFDGGLSGGYSTITKPKQEPEQRKSFFGEINKTKPVLVPANAISPRSPSPVRGSRISRLQGGERSFSAPSMASQILSAPQRPQSTRPAGSPIVGKDLARNDPNLEHVRKARAKKEEEETKPLIDPEDEARQRILQAPIQPALTLDEFVAHPGPALPAGDSIPAQSEAVYRDINAMIDTLGLNARSLTNFIIGHAEELRHRPHRSKDDLTSPDDWTIGQLEDLNIIITRDLAADLEQGRIHDVEHKLEECRGIHRELARERNKRNEIQKARDAVLDPEQARINCMLPLSVEQTAIQNDLRRDYARATQMQAAAEEALTLLRAKLAAVAGKDGGRKQPTLEAVMRTITKMTGAIEKRSSDVDVLENQMRKLGLNASSGAAGATGTGLDGSVFSSSSRGPSSFATPKKFSADRSVGMSTPLGARSSIFRAAASAGAGGDGMSAVATPLRRKLAGYSEGECRAVLERRERRGVILGKLRGSLERKGARVWRVEG